MSKEAKKKFIDKMNEYSEDEEIFPIYSDYTKEELNFNSRLAEAKEEMEQVKKEAAKSKEKGIKEGVRNTALNLIKKGMDVSFISEVTGLSVEEIEALK